jgi:hypothetical protein
MEDIEKILFGFIEVFMELKIRKKKKFIEI